MKGDKKSSRDNRVSKSAAGKRAATKTTADTPVWQQKRSGKRGPEHYQSQPRSGGKRYWRM